MLKVTVFFYDDKLLSPSLKERSELLVALFVDSKVDNSVFERLLTLIVNINQWRHPFVFVSLLSRI